MKKNDKKISMKPKESQRQQLLNDHPENKKICENK